MIVKFDRGLLKVQIVWGLFFSLVPLCLIISSFLNDSLYEDYFGKLFVLFFLLFPLYAGILIQHLIQQAFRSDQLIFLGLKTGIG